MLASLLLAPRSVAEAQDLGRTGQNIHTKIAQPYNLTDILATAYPKRLYIIDGAELEVQIVDATGLVQARYGGWGTGTDALDLPAALYASDNSIFVLDQGRPAIVRLDMQLNQVAAIPIPQDYEPLGFVRDSHRQFWLIMAGRPGLYLFDDRGSLVTVVGDQTSGDDGILAPLLIDRSDGQLAVWDNHRQAVCILSESGAVERWLPVNAITEPFDMVFTGAMIYILTDTGLLNIAVATGERQVQTSDQPLITIFQFAGQLYTVDSEGTISAAAAKP